MPPAPMKRLRRIARSFGLGRVLGIVVMIAFAALRIWDPPPVEAVRLRTFDFYQVIQPREATQRPVVIVDIDEESLNAYGQWPWPRTVVADLVSKLAGLGAIAIAFDVIFPEPDRMSPAVAATSFHDLDEETKAKLAKLPSNDQVLADAIARAKVVVGQSGVHIIPPQSAGQQPLTTGFATMGANPAPYLVTYPGLLRNLPVLEQAAAGHGLFTIRSERDGIVRRVPLVMAAQGAIVPSLTLELLRVVTGAGAIMIRTDDAGIQSVAVPGLVLPTDGNGQLFVHFAPHDPARYVSAKDVLEGRVPADRLDRRLVLIGTSAVGLLDLRTTPVDATMPGVEVHAQVLEAALTGGVLSYPSYAIVYELLAAIVVAIAIIVLAPILAAHSLLAFGLAIVAILVGGSWYFYAHTRTLIDFTYPVAASIAVFGTLIFTNYFREQVARRRIRSAFGQYLAPALVEQLAHSPEKLVLGGEERTMTILFSDVRGFTTISEQYKDDPHGLTTLMNRFLTPMTNAIIDHNGTIDKYMGDAIMAFWNAPIDDPAHEANACRAALEMLARVDRLNRDREVEAAQTGARFIPIKIGVGLNTGQCVVGNMGSDLRFNYSVLGDSVNLASRLEGQTKTYGVHIVAGSKTAIAAKDAFAIIEIDFIKVKGKTEPEVVYAILGGQEVALDDRFQKLRDLTIKMLAAYRSRNWSEALSTVELCRVADERFGLDHFFEIYAERIRAFQLDPPPPDWDGAIALESK